MKFESGYSRSLDKFIVRCGYCKTVATQLRYMKESDWDPVKKQWTCTPTLENAIRIESLSIVARRNGMKIKLRPSYHAKVGEIETCPEVSPVQHKKQRLKNHRQRLPKMPFPPHLKKILCKYQKQGIRFMERRNGRMLLGDDMGLGKTLQALAFMMMHDIERIIVVGTPALKSNWKEECDKWGMDNVQVINGWPSEENQMDDPRVLIINYDILAKWKPILIKWNPSMIVFDEAHKIKNPKAKRTKASKAIAKKCTYAIGLTGTPVENNPHELFNIFNLLRPGMFDWYTYIYRYCDAKSGKMGASNTRELHDILCKTIMLRRMKSEVMKELPPKKRIIVKVSIDLKEYNGLCKDLAVEGTDSTVAGNLAQLRKYVAQEKIAPIIEWIDDFMTCGRKLIVAGFHIALVQALLKHYPGSVGIYGGISDAGRTQARTSFQNDPKVRLFIGNIMAMAEGINLTAASDVLLAEMIYNPKKMEQVEDRSHRKGQTLPVTAYYMIVRGTYEEMQYKMVEHKRGNVDEIVDGKFKMKTKNIKNELIRYIIANS